MSRAKENFGGRIGVRIKSEEVGQWIKELEKGKISVIVNELLEKYYEEHKLD